MLREVRVRVGAVLTGSTVPTDSLDSGDGIRAGQRNSRGAFSHPRRGTSMGGPAMSARFLLTILHRQIGI